MNNEHYRRYGLLGYPLGHSLSPFIHKQIMETVGLKGEYKLYELKPQELFTKLPQLLSFLDGVNVTIPYKQAIIPYLKGLSSSAQVYGAVNTVYQARGYNTDGAGFISCKVPIEEKQVLILGAGGVARVLAVEAARSGAKEIFVHARNHGKAADLAGVVKALGFQDIAFGNSDGNASYGVILNGTPVGMWPNSGSLPIGIEHIRKAEVIFDTIYNPTATRLVLHGKSQGGWSMGGLKMLFAQALAAQKIWNHELDFSPFASELAQVEKSLAKEVLKQNPLKLVITGFMGSGKSTIAKLLAEGMEGLLPYVDLDEVIAQRSEMSIADIFATQGEPAFRKLERECLHEVLQRPGPLVLATGGGAVLQPEAVDLIHSGGGLIIYLDVSLSTAFARIGFDSTRPLLQQGAEATKRLYQARRGLYEQAADLVIQAEGEPRQIVKQIRAVFGWEVD